MGTTSKETTESSVTTKSKDKTSQATISSKELSTETAGVTKPSENTESENNKKTFEVSTKSEKNIKRMKLMNEVVEKLNMTSSSSSSDDCDVIIPSGVAKQRKSPVKIRTKRVFDPNSKQKPTPHVEPPIKKYDASKVKKFMEEQKQQR